uniref:DUF4147 domain-containing protein n=1 Tax=Ignisphaera aggregans TaxID=334771 RepID=A0A7C5YV69_9CREN
MLVWDLSFIRNRSVLERDELHRVALDVVEYALESSDPYKAVLSSIRIVDDRVYVKGVEVEAKGRFHVIGFGKASRRMALALNNVLGSRIVGGVVISPEDAGSIDSIEIVKGDHPIPKENTLKSSQKILDYIQGNVYEDDILFVLISGGGSALFEVPEDNSIYR